MRYYVYTSHPITGERIAVVPNGKKDGNKAEFLCISPGANLSVLWLERQDILRE